MKFNQLLIALLFLITSSLLAEEVIMVRREFSMHNNAAELPADVYINKYYEIGEILAVERKVMIETPGSNQKFLAINIPFCLIKIIFSEGSHSIGRVVYMKNRDELPHIQYYNPIVGDNITKPTKYLMQGYKASDENFKKDYSEAKLNLDPKQTAVVEGFQTIF